MPNYLFLSRSLTLKGKAAKYEYIDGNVCPLVSGHCFPVSLSFYCTTNKNLSGIQQRHLFLTHALHVNWGSAGLGSRPCLMFWSSPYGAHFSGTARYLTHAHSRHMSSLCCFIPSNIPLATASPVAKHKVKRLGNILFYQETMASLWVYNVILSEWRTESIIQSATCPTHTFPQLSLNSFGAFWRVFL